MRRQPVIGDLVLLGWPLVPPWADVDPNMKSLVGGGRLAFADAKSRRQMARFIAACEGRAKEGKSYIVFATREDWALAQEKHFCVGWTVFAQGEHVVSYQSVLFETRFARSQGDGAAGTFFEIDAAHVSAWDGSRLADLPTIKN